MYFVLFVPVLIVFKCSRRQQVLFFNEKQYLKIFMIYFNAYLQHNVKKKTILLNEGFAYPIDPIRKGMNIFIKMCLSFK